MGELKRFVAEEQAVALYFKGNLCGVCEDLLPKMIGLFQKQFPKISFQEVNLNEEKAFSASHQVFTAPTLLVFFEGKEFIRESRMISVRETESKVKRLYRSFFR